MEGEGGGELRLIWSLRRAAGLVEMSGRPRPAYQAVSQKAGMEILKTGQIISAALYQPELRFHCSAPAQPSGAAPSPLRARPSGGTVSSAFFWLSCGPERVKQLNSLRLTGCSLLKVDSLVLCVRSSLFCSLRLLSGQEWTYFQMYSKAPSLTKVRPL
ncbi:hypothetical protein SRHO_G00116260 [Serrasalmus rhombeus]